MNFSHTNIFYLLAAKAGQSSPSGHVKLPGHWPGQGDLLSFCHNMGPGLAAVLILAGVVYLLFGFAMFKTLVMLNAAAVGAVAGALIGTRTNATLPAAIIGGLVAAAITWPLMKYAVAVMGGTFGALLAATIWRAVGLEPSYTWAGALTGLVGGGLLCFILFRGCVMMYTSLQGALMLILGLLGLLFKYQELAPNIGKYMALKPFLLPMCIFVPALAGLMYQQANAKPIAPAGGAPKK